MCFVLYFEENPVVTDPDAPALGGSAQLGDAGRLRVLFKSEKGLCDARADLGRELPAVAFCRSAEQNAVRHYGVSPVSDSRSWREHLGLGLLDQEAINGVLQVWGESVPIHVSGQNAEKGPIVFQRQNHRDNLSPLIVHESGRMRRCTRQDLWSPVSCGHRTLVLREVTEER